MKLLEKAHVEDIELWLKVCTELSHSLTASELPQR
jgi:hypothetical protein